MKRLVPLLSLLLIFTGCILGRVPGKIPFPGGNDDDNKPPMIQTAPAMIFNYHGGKAGLDERGSSGPAVGLASSRYAGITAIGVPMNNSGVFPDRNYIQELRDSVTSTTIRTIETYFDPGRPGNMWGRVNFGAVVLGYASHDHPGEFISAWRDSLQWPADGVGFDIEYPIMNRDMYPVTREDQALAASWEMDLTDREAYIAFRCREIATIFRLMFREAMLKYPACTIAIAYSGYPNLTLSSEGDVRATYGCDFALLAKPDLAWRGETLPALTHAFMGWHTTVELPAGAREWIRNAPLPVLHNLQLAPQLETEANIRSQITDRLTMLRPGRGDGLGLVGYGDLWKFDGPDSTVCALLGQELRSRGFIR